MVEFEFWWLLIIPLFFGLGWFAARIDIAQIISESTDLPSAYFKGLNYLIKNQYEKAAEAFGQAVKINNESLELHFVLGSLYRRTGQLDKAINLHIDLLETRELSQQQQESVKAELALDYFKAGLYDVVLVSGVEKMGTGLLGGDDGAQGISLEGLLGSQTMPAIFSEAGMEHALDDLERQVASIDTKFLS